MNMEVQGVNIGLQGQIAVDYPQSQQSVPADERVVPKQESSPVNPYDKRSQGDDFFTKKIDPEKEEDIEKVQDAVKKANKILEPSFRHFKMSVHKATHRVIVKVMDSATDKVIREVPSEKFLDMVSGFIEMAGIMVDKRA